MMPPADLGVGRQVDGRQEGRKADNVGVGSINIRVVKELGRLGKRCDPQACRS
jgi:hypothetical protein